MKISLSIVALVSLMVLTTGCPGKVQTADAKGSHLGDGSKSWGVPVARPLTAGFNGTPSENVDVGPANTQNAPSPEIKY